MNRLDLAIVRELHREKADPTIGIDPLITAAHLAERIGVSRNTVYARMDSWREEGFLVRMVTVPNPDLFGAKLTGLMVSVEDPDVKTRLLQALDLADDIFCSTEMGSLIWIVYFARYATAMDRWEHYLATLAGVEIISPFTTIPLPRCSRDLTPFDWRMISAMRSTDRPRPGALAKLLGVHSRTVSRHFRNLISANALFVYPIWDFSRTAGAIPFVGVRIDRDADPERVRQAIVQLFPAQVPASPAFPAFIGSEGALREGAPTEFGFLLYLDSAAKVGDVTSIVRKVRGVKKVPIGFPSRTREYPQCFDNMMAAASPYSRSANTRNLPQGPSRAHDSQRTATRGRAK